MADGVVVTVEDGVATVVFPDEQTRLAGVTALLAASEDPKDVQKVTLPQVAYVVPEAVAQTAGVVEDLPIKPAPAPAAPTYDDGKPDMDWSRAAIDAYAIKLGLDPKQYHNKTAVLEAVRAAEA